MIYVKVVQKQSTQSGKMSSRMVRRPRYQDYQQDDSDQYDKIKTKGFSVSVKAEAQFSRTNQFKQSYSLQTRQVQKPNNPQFFLHQQKQTIDYGTELHQNKWMEQLSSSSDYAQSQFPNHQFFKNQQKKKVSQPDESQSFKQQSHKNQWLDTSLDSKNTLSRILQGPFKSLEATSRNKAEMDSINESRNEYITQQIGQSKQHMQGGDYKAAAQVLQQFDKEVEPRFLLAYTLLNLKQYDQAVQILEELLSNNPNFRKESYLFLSIAYNNLNKYDKANIWLNICIKIHPNYYEAYTQLAQNCYKQQDYQSSINHIITAIKLDNDNVFGYMLKADCLMKLKKYSLCSDTYAQIEKQFTQMKNDHRFRIKYCQAMIKSNQIDSVVNKLNQVLMEHPQSGDALFLKGLVQYKKVQYNESLLTFEQVLHTNCPQQICAKSLYYMTKVRVNQRDFYAAQHNLLRFDLYRNTQYLFLNKLKGFLDGTIQLIKRHYKEAIEFYQNLLKTHGLSKFLRPIFYLYKSYGHFCLSEYQQVLDDYKLMTDMGFPLCIGALYNKEICEALLASKKYNFDSAFDKIERASKMCPDKMDPHLYKVCLIIQRGCQNYNEQQRRVVVKDGQLELEKAFATSGKSANLFYIRALIKSYFHRYTSAIKDLDKAIDISEDNHIEHFYLRGILQAQSMRLKQAIKDFSTCIHFNKDYACGYLERSKCYQIIGEQEKAFQDLKKYIKLRPKDSTVHYWAGSLLFHNNAYEEALKAFQECHPTKENQTLIVKCHLKLQELDSAHDVLTSMVKTNNDDHIRVDHEIVGIVRRTVELSLKKNKQKVENAKDPNLNLQYSHDVLEKMGQTTKLSPQNFGNIFSLQDFHLHRAIVCFYLKSFSKCLQDLNLLDNFWQDKRDSRAGNQNSSLVINTEESEQAQNQMILKSERVIQHIIAIKYNIILTNLMMQKYHDAIDQCTRIKALIGDVQSEEINYLEETSLNLIENKPIARFPKTMVFLMNEQSLFNFYPTVRIPLKINHKLECKLSVSLPDIQPPNICPSFDVKLIETISPSLVENKPEAPWVKRENKALVFTDNMYYADELNLLTEEDIQSVKSDNYQANNREQLKQALKLDDKIQNKLNKLVKQDIEA